MVASVEQVELKEVSSDPEPVVPEGERIWEVLLLHTVEVVVVEVATMPLLRTVEEIAELMALIKMLIIVVINKVATIVVSAVELGMIHLMSKLTSL